MKNEINSLFGAHITRLASAGLVTIISLCGYAAAQAAPITYTISSVGTGVLGANPFNNASFIITATADTTQITQPITGLFQVPDLSAVIFISGLGTATFTDSTIAFANQSNPAVGIERRINPLDILDVQNAAFGSYDLSTSIGPLSGPAVFNSADTITGASYGTTAGNFSLTSVSTATFQATTVPSVPDASPTSILLLLGVGATFGLNLLLRQRFAA